MTQQIITRETYEKAEHERLSDRAAFADRSKGRERTSVLDPFRTEFQRDRDRIIHCKAFRRLSHKTQVFLAPEGDHYRTRLTHTLEVAQIARSIARALQLNEDLTEAIALGHDLGHTPFGHTGEDALSHAIAVYKGLDPETHKRLYRHNEQSLRVVEVLEYDGRGLNLTWEVRDGIRHHTGAEKAATLEGRIVATSDRIAYVNHDIDDAIRGGVISESDLPRTTHEVLGTTPAERITTMVNDMIVTSSEGDDIAMSAPVWNAMMELRKYLFNNVYFASSAKVEEPKAYNLIRSLFKHYTLNPDEIPHEFMESAGGLPEVAITDYIAGMTDRYAISTFEQLYLPKNWQEVREADRGTA